jgi:glutathione synthase/RimK-type ligase-like ATP-grasp enzyme
VILLVTSTEDLTTDYLIRRIEERGLPFFRFNTEEVLSGFDLSLNITANTVDFSITDLTRGVVLKRDAIRGAYLRRPGIAKLSKTASEDAEYDFNNREAQETLRSLWRMIPKRTWLNDPENLWLANNKVKQLLVARELGFTVPETLISSQRREVLEFIETHGRSIIAKAVKNGFFNSHRTTNLIFTRSLEPHDIRAISASKQIVPSILQPQLDKDCDLRITIAGEAVFSVALLSQQHSETKVDWRTWDISDGIDLIHEEFDLPAKVRQQCLELHRRLGLNFSCIDMVLTKSGDFVFLEVNPNGQWAWIENMVGLPIRDAIIDYLTRTSEP